MENSPHAVFAYGTLKRNQELAQLWPEQPFSIVDGFTKGQLYDLGDYPALIHGEDWIQGEIWQFEPQYLPRVLRTLDEIEVYQQPASDDLYVRRVTSCKSMCGEMMQAFVYFYAQPNRLTPDQKMIPDASGRVKWP